MDYDAQLKHFLHWMHRNEARLAFLQNFPNKSAVTLDLRIYVPEKDQILKIQRAIPHGNIDHELSDRVIDMTQEIDAAKAKLLAEK